MLANTQPTDEVQTWIETILCSDDSHESKMLQLEALEPTICGQYAKGLTQVKPVHLMTADDLVS